jgi:hypothetical protein
VSDVEIYLIAASGAAARIGFGRHRCREGLWVLLRSGVFDQGQNLHELDGGPHAVETRYALEKGIGEKVSGCVLSVPDVEVCGLALFGIDRESFGT